MGAREYFERLRDDSSELAKRAEKVQELRAQLGSHGHKYGSTGGVSNPDAMAAVDRIIEVEQELAKDQARHDLELEQACAILYGWSGRGGLARERGSVDADIICCHFLQGMSYKQIATELAKPNSANPESWCRQRASRALKYIDSVGADALADS